MIEDLHTLLLEGWVTMNGTPVLIGDDGEIKAGPERVKQDLQPLHKWEQKDGGYVSSNGAELTKEGKQWILTDQYGNPHVMPKKPTLDHADRIIHQAQQRNKDLFAEVWKDVDQTIDWNGLRQPIPNVDGIVHKTSVRLNQTGGFQGIPLRHGEVSQIAKEIKRQYNLGLLRATGDTRPLKGTPNREEKVEVSNDYRGPDPKAVVRQLSTFEHQGYKLGEIRFSQIQEGDSKPGYEFKLLARDGKIAAEGTTSISGQTATRNWYTTKEGHRGKGLARAWTMHEENLLRSLGVKRIQLLAEQDGPAVWRKLGYQVEEGDADQAPYMWKDL